MEPEKNDKVLFGAPEIVHGKPYRLVRCRSVGRYIKPGVHKKTRQELKDHFSRVPFKSFLCLPIIGPKKNGGKQGIVGVLNIESSHSDFFGSVFKNSNPDAACKKFSYKLQPFCFLLGNAI